MLYLNSRIKEVFYMKKNKYIITIFSIIALCILAINIILTIVAGLDILCAILTTLFVVALTSLLFYISKPEDKNYQKKTPLINIEDTIILKLEDLQSEGITPIRNKEEIEIIDDSSIKEDLETQRASNVTKETIEEELSKTMFINDLKGRMKAFEEEQEKIREKEEEKELKELNKLIKAKNKNK